MKGVKLMFEYFLRDGETPEEFQYRVCLDKMEGKIRTWDKVADIINDVLGLDKGESTYRKAFKKRYDNLKMQNFSSSEGGWDDFSSTSPSIIPIDNEEDEDYKKKTDLRDWANYKRKVLRDEARIDRIIKALKEPIRLLPSLVVSDVIEEGVNEAILTISDWHYGDKIINFYNEFDRKIFNERLQNLQDRVLQYCKRNSVKRLHVLNLGDLFAGNIHVSNRVTAEMDVITQIKEVAEALATFLNNLSNEISDTRYYSVLDNHSRTNKVYTEHIEKENLGRLIDWWLEERLKGSNLNIIQEKIDDNIGFLQLENGKNVFFTHGHLDNGINNVVQNYTLSSGKIAHYVFLGHWHNKKQKEYQGSKVFVNGSLRGVDDYALSKRLFAKPSQNLVIFDGEDEIDISVNLG